MSVSRLYNRKKVFVAMFVCTLLLLSLMGRIIYIMLFQYGSLSAGAENVHMRERYIKAPRGNIYDRNGTLLASNKTVCTISVIHSQIEDPKAVITLLSKELLIDSEQIAKKVNKISSREKIKSNVEKKIGDKIRSANLKGIKVDEDYKRFYVYDTLASKVIGFTGGDNQGIVGIEAKYDKYLMGNDGLIMTVTDSRGIELEGALEVRKESCPGNDLYLTIDANIQQYASQIARAALKKKQANYVSILVMNPKNGEILAMINEPEYNLNDPYKLNYESQVQQESSEFQNLLNKMWRNQSINDTYEPGSTFKIITATAGLEEKVVNISSTFSCPGYKVVEDRHIRCHKTTGHGAETFLQGVMNSCNPVFMTVGERVGVEAFYKYFDKLGLTKKTGVDLPGEAGLILHNKKNVGPVELATMSFGQSFQITPISLLRTVSGIINGGKLVTPHFALKVVDQSEKKSKIFEYAFVDNIISKDTSETMKYILEKVVSEGTGKKGAVEGYKVGGKTATSQKLPRSAGKYISSYIGFAPANDPEIIALAIIDEPQGIYYGGTIAAPLIKQLYENILPAYLK